MIIKLGPYNFSLSEPFTEGHRLSAEEARVMNAYRADSIAKNIKRRFDGALKRADGLALSPTEQEAFQAYISRYDTDFVIGKGFPGTKPGAIEHEARKLAVARLPDGSDSASIEALAATAPIMEEARQRVASRQQIASAGLEDLLA